MEVDKIVAKKIIPNKSINDQIEKELSLILNKNIKDGNKTILVLSGGGIKGIAHLGAIKALEEKNIMKNITTYAGTSAGALILALINIGYTSDELHDFIKLFDMNRMKSMNPQNILSAYGLDDGKNIMIVLEKLFKTKKIDTNITFFELYKKTGKTLILTSSCINDKKIYYFSHEKYPDLQILKAVRMSISIPIYFEPVKYEGKIFIDGGCIDNYPIQLFKNNLESVIGVYVSSKREYAENITNIEAFLLNTIECLFEGVTCGSLKGFEKVSIKINLEQKHAMELDLSLEKKEYIYKCGYDTVINSPIVLGI